MSSLSRFIGALQIAIGLFVGAFSTSRAIGLSPPPTPLTISLLVTAVLLVVLGVGVWRRARAAWAFSVALLGTGTTALLLAIPEFLRGGYHSAVVLGAVVLVAVVLGLLIVARKEVS